MSWIRKENDVNANLSVVNSCSKPFKQKSLSQKPLNSIAYNVYDMAAKQSKTKKTLAKDLSDEEKESVIQEVLDYMLGRRSPVASSPDCFLCKGVPPTKEKCSQSCSHNQRSVTGLPVYRSSPHKHLNSANFSKKNCVTPTTKDKKAKQTKIINGKQAEEQRESPIKKWLENGSNATKAVASTESTYASNTLGKEHFQSSKRSKQVGDSKCQYTSKTYIKPFGEKCSMDNHSCLECQELKGVKSTAPLKRQSRYWGRKSCTQPLKSDKTDSCVRQPHQNNKSQSCKAIIQTSSANGTTYWPRVLISSHLNVLFSRITAENDNMLYRV
ncbi:uncharacterized protein LOC130703383 [Daphnia carinata]|uniref:uncharacterized protein LOC130703383 n=1 Tax=Daphnia carinata TaxID=120202 RepID=UPI00257DD746|nr:uncharacterized protein LOC130703383 [Daphnia carinata]